MLKRILTLILFFCLAYPSSGIVVGDYDEAEDVYNEGVDYLKTGDWAEAEAGFLKALEMGCELEYNAYMGIGQARANSANYEGAINAFRKAEAINKSYRVYRCLADAYLKSGDTDSFIGAISKAVDADSLVSADSQMYKAYVTAGDYETDVGNYEEGIAYYERAVLLSPGAYSGNYGLGLAYYEMGDYDEAIRFFDVAIENDLAAPEAYLNIGNVYFKKGEYGPALDNYQTGIGLTNDIDLKNRFLNNITTTENAVNEIEATRGVPTADFNEAVTLIDTGNKLLGNGEIEEAISKYRQARDINPYAYYGWYNAAVGYLRLKEYDSCIDCLLGAEDIEPKNPKAFFLHARVAAVTGDYETAFERLEYAISLDPSYAAKAKNDGVFDEVFETFGGIK
ncbi:MAG: tetratricopeptide repeat protein [bacterium]|nr:tetratricopeptide repeat protein [bacterium]